MVLLEVAGGARFLLRPVFLLVEPLPLLDLLVILAAIEDAVTRSITELRIDPFCHKRTTAFEAGFFVTYMDNARALIRGVIGRHS